MRDHPWMTDGLMQDNCRFGDMLKDEKRKSQFNWEGLWVSMQFPCLWETSLEQQRNQEARALEEP